MNSHFNYLVMESNAEGWWVAAALWGGGGWTHTLIFGGVGVARPKPLKPLRRLPPNG